MGAVGRFAFRQAEQADDRGERQQDDQEHPDRPDQLRVGRFPELLQNGGHQAHQDAPDHDHDLQQSGDPGAAVVVAGQLQRPRRVADRPGIESDVKQREREKQVKYRGRLGRVVDQQHGQHQDGHRGGQPRPPSSPACRVAVHQHAAGRGHEHVHDLGEQEDQPDRGGAESLLFRVKGGQKHEHRYQQGVQAQGGQGEPDHPRVAGVNVAHWKIPLPVAC